MACYVRIFMVKAFGRDDWLMVIATASPLRIYATQAHHYRIIITAMFVSVVAGATFFFVCLFQCYPISFMWDRTSQEGKCIDNTVITVLGYIYSVFSIISDFTFAIIPGFLVWHLQLKRRTKVALIPLITMGCIASAAVIARLPFVHFFNSPDFLWSTLDIAIWSTVEQGLAITAGSLATLRPLFFIAMHKLGLSTRPSGYRPSAYGMSAPLPNKGASGMGSRADKLRPDMYKLSATVQTRTSDDQPLEPKGKSPNWFDHPSSKKGTRNDNSDNDSENSMHIKSARNSAEEHFQNGIMVSKSFYITDEERGSVISAPYR
ncbi:integral membrane [Pyrenophora seminiperda CCB06]|uniref:Integral membrane n=1 Tax=Pyrenophora seminiperda CCB06 TaxID=1302712 RepID=A0A3M7M4D8_9PLEO|nr:integral membrane [Pyrenophora seminiperda CCB06]